MKIKTELLFRLLLCGISILLFFFSLTDVFSENKPENSTINKALKKTIQVIVKDSNGKSLIGANIKIKGASKVLILILEDNIKSNYFVNDMLAEDINISVDSLQLIYNTIIINNLQEIASKSNLNLIIAHENQSVTKLKKQIELIGENEDAVADFKNVDKELLIQVLDETDSDYVFVLNQHYLKYQDKPMKTVFHILSYSVFDKDKNEITSGNNFFTYIKLSEPEDISKLSKKTASKIISSIYKKLM